MREDVFTDQLFTLSHAGHDSPPPAFGAPTLVWHVAFWPKRNCDAHNITMVTKKGSAFLLTSDKSVREEFDLKRSHVSEDLNKFLKALQDRARAGSDGRDKPDTFVMERPIDLPQIGGSADQGFSVFRQTSLGFTLWWEDDGEAPIRDRKDRLPIPSDLRVRVEVKAHSDFTSITFLIDVGKPWSSNATFSSDFADGKRRKDLFQAIELIREICEKRVADDTLVDAEWTPEPDANFENNAKSLKVQGDKLYASVWTAFCKSFNFDEGDIAGQTDEIFANFRGVISSVHWVSGSDKPTQDGKSVARSIGMDKTASPGTVPFARFEFGGGIGWGGAGYAGKVTEPNRIIKGYAPFVRRMSPDADFRDWIACGVFDGRALLLAPFGIPPRIGLLDEGNIGTTVPAGSIPLGNQLDRRSPSRYLLLTKFEPHRRQVGRMIDRVNLLKHGACARLRTGGNPRRWNVAATTKHSTRRNVSIVE